MLALALALALVLVEVLVPRAKKHSNVSYATVVATCSHCRRPDLDVQHIATISFAYAQALV